MELYKLTFLLLIFVSDIILNGVTAEIDKSQADILQYPHAFCKYGYHYNSYFTCKNHGHKLTYIPKLDYVRHLYFTGNYLQNVSQGTFVNISTSELKALSLANNSIVNIANDTFENFDQLVFLNLGSNNISASSFESLFSSLSTLDNLDTLSLQSLFIPNIPDDFFDNIAGTQINILKLIRNNITRLPSSVFTSFKYLDELSLKWNAIQHFEMKEVMTSLHLLNLDNNKLTRFPNFCSRNKSSLVPEIRELFLINNALTAISKDMFQCVTSLHTLDISGNHFHVLENDILYHLKSLASLRIKWIQSSRFHFQPYAFRSLSLKNLDLKNHKKAYYLFRSYVDAFNNTPNLRVLNLQSISFAECAIRDLEIFVQPLAKLQHISLYNGRVMVISGEMFDHMPNLEIINLERNELTSFKNAPFKNLHHIKELKLSHNMITTLAKNNLPLSQPSLKFLDLASNPFDCTCQLTWFTTWLSSADSHVKRYPKHYTCASPTIWKGKRLKDVKFTYRECHPFTPYEWVAMIGGPSLVVIVVVATILYRNRWTIKHYIYLVRKRRNYERIENNDFVYDAFVGYSQMDYEWITGTLLPKLEEEENYRLCVHDRDFTPGKYILDNIVTHLDISRKIILVVSNEFAKSEWCRFELKLAQKRSIDDDTDTVIVVLLEALQAQNVPKSMKVLLNTTTYIEWTNDPVGEQLFWTKLTDVLRRPA